MGGATALHMRYIARQFEDTPQAQDQVRREVVVVLSDGEDTSSLVSFDEVVDGKTIAGGDLRLAWARRAAGEAASQARADLKGVESLPFDAWLRKPAVDYSSRSGRKNCRTSTR